MAKLLYWPGQYCFYPIGNTSAVCLTRDLAPEDSARMLLLGCGDPKNVLYTIFCEPQYCDRLLDFTCCDFDPGILARNVLLLTMVADHQLSQAVVWNIFFHMYLDSDSYKLLVEHCNELIKLSDTLEHWNVSRYAPFIKMRTEYTLAEIRRYWMLYTKMHDLPPQQIKAITKGFTERAQEASSKVEMVLTSARSAGPLLWNAVMVSSELHSRFWKTGTTFSDPKQVALATLLNPTFVYCLGGEGCYVQRGIDPMVPFRSAPVFGNTTSPVSVADFVKAGIAEFSDWCSAFHHAVTSSANNPPIVRFFLGEAIAVCQALRDFRLTGTFNSDIPVAPWKGQLLQLSRHEYANKDTPITFNVIDTSNLDHHIRLLNILLAAIPLLRRFGVLYTESLLYLGKNATKDFKNHLPADITTISLLVDLCPVDYLSGFTARSNTHELLGQRMFREDFAQFHQVMTWKPPSSGDSLVSQARVKCGPPVFDRHQLGTLLYDIYRQMFEQENPMQFLTLNDRNLSKAISLSNLVHYTRETFVVLLKLIRDRPDISKEQWIDVMDRFFGHRDADKSMEMDTLHYHDLCVELCRHGVYELPVYRVSLLKTYRFSEWDTVPPLVRIILTIPREDFTKIARSLEEAGTPALQCDIRGNMTHNVFTAVQVAFGRVVQTGPRSNPRVLLEEDLIGWEGTSPLIATFTVPAGILINFGPAGNIKVELSVRPTAGTIRVFNSLRLSPTLFSASFMDESLVHVLPEQPLPTRQHQVLSQPSEPANIGLFSQIGKTIAPTVELDDECELVASLTSTLFIENDEVKALFRSGATPNIKEVSPCVMRIGIGSRKQDLTYPFPVIGSQSRARLARKSLYIEVIVPISGQLKPDGMKINPFAVVGTESSLSPWSIHRLNITRMPILDTSAITDPKVDHWLNTHICLMMSSRERSLREKRKNDNLMLVKDTLLSIFAHSSGVRGGPIRRHFALVDNTTKNTDTSIFISDLRFDLQSHTVVCDGYVLPTTDELMPKINSPFSKLVLGGHICHISLFHDELKAWKQLLPAYVERCRTWRHGDNCEYKSQGKVPLTEVRDEDPLCSCGRGKDAEGMRKVALWSELAPYVTRIALSPLFAVSYLESVGRDPASRRCYVCGGKGKPKLMTCSVCLKARYCSSACQDEGWKTHKVQCKS